MAEMILQAKGSKLKIISEIHVTSTQAQYDTCLFQFDEAWDDYGVRTAVFYSNPNNRKLMLLDSQNRCYIPWDSFSNSRYLYIGVYGSNGESYLPTQFVEVMYQPGAMQDDHLYPPTPGIYEQIIAALHDISLGLTGKVDQSVLDAANMLINTKASQASVDALSSQLLALGSGAPAGIYSDLAALNAANPERSKIYLTLDNGHWNYWDGTAFVSGGVYQTIQGIDDLTEGLGDAHSLIYTIDSTLFINQELDTTSGARNDSAYYVSTKNKIPFAPGDTITIKSDLYRFRLWFFLKDGSYNPNKQLGWFTNTSYTFTAADFTYNGFIVIGITRISGLYPIAVKDVVPSLASNMDALKTRSNDGLAEMAKKATDDIAALKAHIGKDYDVCIVGGGAAGVAAGYVLKDSGLRVCLIERQPYLGGIHTQAWVASLAAAPAPRFLEEVVHHQIRMGQAIISVGEHTPMTKADALAMPFKRTFHHNPVNYCINFNPRSMAMKYYADLSPDIDIILNENVVSGVIENRFVKSVTTQSGLVVKAKVFLDCSAFNSLLRATGGNVIWGGDSSTRYQATHGFTEPDAHNVNYEFVNAATLMYRVAKGVEDLSSVAAAYYNHSAYFFYGNPDLYPKVYMNTINYVDADGGTKVVKYGEDAIYKDLAPKMIKHWKTIKEGAMVDLLPGGSSTYRFDGIAPMLGVRESYRAICARMLNENGMFIRASAIDDEPNLLDRTIAVGGYIADLFNDPNISQAAAESISSRIQQFPVPYGCLVPSGYDNTLVASRGAGFTHIAASSFRLTKHMMQIGWFAGYAARQFIEEELIDFRTVNITGLKRDEYAGTTTMINDALTFNT